MSTTESTTPVQRAAHAIYADSDLAWPLSALSDEDRGEYLGKAHAALLVALDRDEIARVLGRATWPDGGHDGFPSRKVAEMLADALIAHLTGARA